VTAPQADGADRISGLARRRARASTAAGSIALLLLIGLLIRLTIAYIILPGSGFETDIATYSSWAQTLYENGPGTFYAVAGFADYPPGYLYLIWLGTHVVSFLRGDTIEGTADLLKLGPILFDVLIAWVLYVLVRRWSATRKDSLRLGLVAAGLYLFNPVTIYDSAIWGQTDSVGTLLVLLGVAALVRGNSEGATVLAVLAALVKPQFGIVLAPLVGVVLLRRHLLRAGSSPRHRPLVPEAMRSWFEREQGVVRLFTSAVAGLVVLVVLLAPFRLNPISFIELLVRTAGGYPYLSVNAYNPWALVGSGGTPPLALGGWWSPDTIPLLGPLPAVVIGTALLAAGFLVGIARAGWREDRRSIIIVAIFLALAFFILPTRVHERYMFPIFGLIPLLAVVDRRWLAAGVVLSIAAFMNLHAILTIPLYATPNLESMPLGAEFRTPLGILTSIGLHTAGFLYVAWQLRPSAAREEDPFVSDMQESYEDVWEEPPVAAPWSTSLVDVEPGWQPSPRRRSLVREWLASLVERHSTRRDRSTTLANESGGRLDRRDLLLVALVFVSTLALRTYRLEVPYGMHFDEVYHARTAVEFLQDWQYDMPHSIYEYTHPHLAKYTMALGIITLGNNRVVDNRDLGGEVVTAAVEPRWSPAGSPSVRNGERLYVVTPDGLLVHDLATRAEAVGLDGAFDAVAVDEASHVVYLGQADGTVLWLPSGQFDDLRNRGSVPQTAPIRLTSLAGLDGPLDRLEVAGGRLIAISVSGTVVSLDLQTGTETGRLQLEEPSSLAGITARSVVFVDPTQLTDAAAVADTLAGLLGDDAARIETAITTSTDRVAVAGFIGDVGDDVQAAIDEGRLTGASVEDPSGLAVGTHDGVVLLEAQTLTELTTLETAGPVSGLALVSHGLEHPTLYAASGGSLVSMRLPTDQPPSTSGTLTMPNTVTQVAWNPATTLVHALGRSQEGRGWTVYVVEPRSNSVFADARLESEPQQMLVDVAADYPAEDRDDLLLIDSRGGLQTVDVGGNQFAYRFPGVLLGALMAVCIYLLGRFLFRRRMVAAIAAFLVLFDGMFFANARIAMNDAYVAFFIVAAFTVFVPLWLGRWRSGWATAGGLALVGILLGLALASKWVGAYAIGGVVLLILLRSALGRIIALAAMIAMTAVLGFVAVTPSAAVQNPQLNYAFLALMVVLSALLAVAIALRPVRFTLEELRFVVVVPVLGGALIGAVGGYLDLGERVIGLGVGLVVVGLAAAALGWLAGRRGIGPLARIRAAGDSGEPAAPPPERGWLRPGSGRLGLPWLAALAAVTLIPLAVYVFSYTPWIDLGNRWTAADQPILGITLPNLPADHTGQSFLDMQRGMYDYHNYLRATHPASSPWWAWPLDLKPVWFEQQDYAGRTTAVIYDTGNLVIFWLAIPAVAFVAWQAWRRRSLALTFLALAIASLWLPWARIDRATFQYHIFTTLPFSFLALAYFLSELWHGPSPRTWLLARAGAALAIIGAPLLWLLRVPLCGVARTEQVNPGTEVCAALSRQLVLSDVQLVGLLLAVGGLAAAGVLVYLGLRSDSQPDRLSSARPLLLPLAFSVVLFGGAIVVVGAGLAGNPAVQTTVRAEEPALVALLMLGVPAYFVLRASDPRRFVIGALAAVAIWFVAFYPNIASLPVPTPLSQIHLGLLPTWNWGFQFAVNTDEPNRGAIDWASVGLLATAVLGLCLAAAYAARNWYRYRYADEPITALPEAS
jgi:dolichyl-phosphate-mannose--protein O-mannosyl transferase/Gpi18-like mannosyltransferase